MPGSLGSLEVGTETAHRERRFVFVCPFGESRKGFSLAKAHPRIGFIGAGRVGAALAFALGDAGYPVVAVASRGRDSADSLAAAISGARSRSSAQEVADEADLVFVTTPDAAIEAVAESVRWPAGISVVHTSGALSRDALAAAARQGARAGSLHPLQSFADPRQARKNLPGSVFGVEAEPGLKETLLAIVADLGGTAVELRAEDKALYHAAAVLISNYTLTLTKLSTDLWLRFGWERPAALKALLPLLKGTIANLEALGLTGALTGPVARGDVATVQAHLDALAAAAPEILPAYRELALQTIPVAVAAATLSDAGAAALRAALGSAPAPDDVARTFRSRRPGPEGRPSLSPASITSSGRPKAGAKTS